MPGSKKIKGKSKAVEVMPSMSMAWGSGNDRMDEDGSDEEESGSGVQESGSDASEAGSDGDDSQDNDSDGDSGDEMNEESDRSEDDEGESVDEQDGVAELPNPVSVRERIDTNLEILSNFKAYRDTLTKSRSEVVDELVRDLSEYYSMQKGLKTLPKK